MLASENEPADEPENALVPALASAPADALAEAPADAVALADATAPAAMSFRKSAALGKAPLCEKELELLNAIINSFN